MFDWLKSLFEPVPLHNVQLVVLGNHDDDFNKELAKASFVKKILRLDCDIEMLHFHFLDRTVINEPDNVHEIGISGFDPITKINPFQPELMKIIDKICDKTDRVVIIYKSNHSYAIEHYNFIKNKMEKAGLKVLTLKRDEDGCNYTCSYNENGNLAVNHRPFREVVAQWLKRN